MKARLLLELNLASLFSPVAIPLGFLIGSAVIAIIYGGSWELLGMPFAFLLLTLFGLASLTTSLLIVAFWSFLGGVSLIEYALLFTLLYGSLSVFLVGWYVIGYIAISIARGALALGGVRFRALVVARPKPRPPDQDLHSNGAALVSYIKQARYQGLSDDFINHNLVSNGWSHDNITKAFQRVEGT